MAFQGFRGFHAPKQLLQLTFDEYLDTWMQLLNTFYQEGISDEAIVNDLHLNEDAVQRFSVEFSTLLVVQAVRIWKRRTKIRTKAREQVAEAIPRQFFEGITGGNAASLSACLSYYENRYELFDELCRSLKCDKDERLKFESAGIARALVSQISDADEETNQKVIERIALRFSDACSVFDRLVTNTVLDSARMMMFSKTPGFLVQQ